MLRPEDEFRGTGRATEHTSGEPAPTCSGRRPLPDGRPKGATGATHTLSASAFAGLAQGGGGAEAVAELRAGQRSRTMLLLRAFVELADGHPGLPGPLNPFDEVWRLLVRAEDSSPSSVESLLSHPQLKAWLSRCLRRIRKGESGVVPLWTEAGYLHTAAASAALLAGIRFRIRVPVRDGGVVFPGLGRLNLPGEDVAVAEIVRVAQGQTAQALTGGRQARLPLRFTPDTPDTADWSSLRSLSASHEGHACSPLLDDLDPYRDFLRPTPPDRMSPESLRSWREQFALAWPLVASQRNIDPAGIAACLLSVVPVHYDAHPDLFSASSPEAFGCVLLNPPPGPEALAACLVHEAQHIKLSALMDLVPLIHGGLEEVHYAPWRTDPRPLRGVLQGVYAFMGVAGFWQARMQAARDARDARAAQVAAFEFALRRAQTAAGVHTLRRHAHLTARGEGLLTSLEDRLAPWLAEQVREHPARLAADVVTDHRLVYRMRHRLPDPEAVARWAQAWRRRQPPPEALPRTTLRAGPGGVASRIALARSRLAGSADPAAASRPPRSGTGGGPDAADLAWVKGDVGAAQEGYARLLRKDADDVFAWAGLALTLSAGPARQALRERPEVVLGLHRSLRHSEAPRPDPLAVADFVGIRC